jgi:hypothetical protein
MSNVKKSNVKILEHELVFAHIGHLLLLLLLSCSEHRSGCDGFLADGRRKPIGLLQKSRLHKSPSVSRRRAFCLLTGFTRFTGFYDLF